MPLRAPRRAACARPGPSTPHCSPPPPTAATPPPPARPTGKRQCLIRPSSKVIVRFLEVMQKAGAFRGSRRGKLLGAPLLLPAECHSLPPRTRRARPAEYIGPFEIVDDHRSGKIVVTLLGRINKCVLPRAPARRAVPRAHAPGTATCARALSTAPPPIFPLPSRAGAASSARASTSR